MPRPTKTKRKSANAAQVVVQRASLANARLDLSGASDELAARLRMVAGHIEWLKQSQRPPVKCNYTMAGYIVNVRKTPKGVVYEFRSAEHPACSHSSLRALAESEICEEQKARELLQLERWEVDVKL